MASINFEALEAAFTDKLFFKPLTSNQKKYLFPTVVLAASLLTEIEKNSQSKPSDLAKTLSIHQNTVNSLNRWLKEKQLIEPIEGGYKIGFERKATALKRQRYDREIKELLQLGFNKKEIASQIGISTVTLNIRLKELKINALDLKNSDISIRNLEILRKYLNGCSCTELAKLYGLSVSRVSRLLQRLNAPRGKNHKYERNEQIYKDRLAGMTLLALAKKYGISKSRVMQVIEKEKRKRT